MILGAVLFRAGHPEKAFDKLNVAVQKRGGLIDAEQLGFRESLGLQHLYLRNVAEA